MHFFCLKPGGKHRVWSSWVHKRYFEKFSLPKPLVSVSWLGRFCRCFGWIWHSLPSLLPLCSSGISFLQSHLRWIRKMFAVSGAASVWIFYLSSGKQKQQLSWKIWKRAKKCHFGSKASFVAKGKRFGFFWTVCWTLVGGASSPAHVSQGLEATAALGRDEGFSISWKMSTEEALTWRNCFLRKMLF